MCESLSELPPGKWNPSSGVMSRSQIDAIICSLAGLSGDSMDFYLSVPESCGLLWQASLGMRSYLREKYAFGMTFAVVGFDPPFETDRDYGKMFLTYWCRDLTYDSFGVTIGDYSFNLVSELSGRDLVGLSVCRSVMMKNWDVIKHQVSNSTAPAEFEKRLNDIKAFLVRPEFSHTGGQVFH